MAESRKQELVLEGLCCTSCSDKIEAGVGGLPGVERARLNFLDKTLAIDLAADGDAGKVLAEARRVIKDIEPEIVIGEKMLNASDRKIWLVMGLCCADCARTIEESIGRIEGVSRARVDFGRGELRLDLENEKQAPRVLRESKRRARLVVKGARVRSRELAARRMRNLKLAALIAGAPLFVLGLANLVPALTLPFFIASYLLFGADVLWRALRNILKGRVFDENFLMTVATAGAFAVGAWPEAAAVMLFYKIGITLEDSAVERSRRSIKAALALRPDSAHRLVRGELETIRPEEAAIDDAIRVLPGERVPLDAVVIEGSSYVDSSLLSGEAAPVLKRPGDLLYAGTVNRNGVLTARVEKTAADSAVARIIDFVEKANLKKAKTEHFIGAFTRVYTPLVVAAAALIAFVPLPFTGLASWQTWLYRALVFLVISCPCALVLSIPLTFAAGIGSLARAGVLVKGGRYVEALRTAGTVVFDKTGTLTENAFRVAAVQARAPFTEEEVLSLAGRTEVFSAHPAAIAIRSAWESGGRGDSAAARDSIDLYDEKAGLGVTALVDGTPVAVGSARLLKLEGVELSAESAGDGAAGDGVVHVAAGGRYAGSIRITEKVKTNAREAIGELKLLGADRIAMLSGDLPARAGAVGAELGIDEVYAPLLPEEKVDRFERIKAETERGRTVVAVGDGVNDAPLLARADVGAAMGGLGREAAVEAADLVILDDDLAKLPLAVRLSKKTHRLVIENVALAFGVKALVLVLGALGIATMWEAVFADVGVALLALANALRILRKK
ncbi:MAG: heavy metal translocating P-type ATPase [Spirochaetales bacterium]|nr:heavy metal translocating P-type ATPase [Spirochaetales bacterium]